MKLDNAHVVKSLFTELESLNADVRNILFGFVDATIYGRYFGDKLPDEEYEKMRDIALRYVARQYWSIMQTLKLTHGIPIEFPDWTINTIDNLMNYWKHHQKPVRRKD